MLATAFWFGMVWCIHNANTWLEWLLVSTPELHGQADTVVEVLESSRLLFIYAWVKPGRDFVLIVFGLLLRLLLLCLLLHLKTRFLLSPVAAELTTNINLNLNCNSHRTLYTISHTLITTLCVSMYARFHIKLIQRTRSLQNLTCWNSKSIWIMSSVITCAVITWTPTCFNSVCMYG